MDTFPEPTSFDSGLATLLPALRRRARYLTADASQADDLVSDTLERALRFKETFTQGSNLRAWLFRILSNCFVSQKRRQGVERRVLQRAAFDPNGWTCREACVQTPELSLPVVRALDALPERLRSVVCLVDLDEGSYKDAADALGVPVGTVMSRLHRGRARLAQSLAERGAQPEAA